MSKYPIPVSLDHPLPGENAVSPLPSTLARRRWSMILVAGMLATSLVVGGRAHAANARFTPSAGSTHQTLNISVTPDGFTAPGIIRAGSVTLKVSSTDPGGAWVGLVRPRPGVTLERYLNDLERAMSDDPATAVAGGKAVAKDVDMLGGAAVAHVPAATTMLVAPGSYYLVDFRDVGLPDLSSRVRPLRVEGWGRPGGGVPPDGLIAQVDAGDSARFIAPRVLSSPVTVRVTNFSRQHNEAMLMRVRPGTTNADLTAFFKSVDVGQHWPVPPFVGGPTGVVPVSPGHSAVLSTDLPAGEYALVTWVRNLGTGKMLAAEGMHALVTITEAR